jgi:hypothetical protein
MLTHAMSPCRLGYSGERLVMATESNKLLACSSSDNEHVDCMNLGDMYIRAHHVARQNLMISTLSITRRCLFFSLALGIHSFCMKHRMAIPHV